jgi:hypothetical protein
MRHQDMTVTDFKLDSPGGIHRWISFFELLSLDSAEPYLGLLGIRVEYPEKLRRIARDFLTKLNERGDDPKEWQASYDVQLLTDVFHDLKKALGREASNRLYTYATNDAVEEFVDSGTEFVWSQLFWQLAFGSDEGYEIDALELSPQRAEQVRSTVSNLLAKDLWESVEEKVAQPRSAWDSGLLEERGSAVPTNFVQLITYSATTEIWRKFAKTLSPHELEAVLKWGRSQAAIVGIPVELVKVPPYVSRS